VLNLHNKLQVMLIETKHSCENIKVRHFGKKHGKNTGLWQNHGIHGI